MEVLLLKDLLLLLMDEAVVGWEDELQYHVGEKIMEVLLAERQALLGEITTCHQEMTVMLLKIVTRAEIIQVPVIPRSMLHHLETMHTVIMDIRVLGMNITLEDIVIVMAMVGVVREIILTIQLEAHTEIRMTVMVALVVHHQPEGPL